MGYRSNSYDPNYQMNAEELRRHRRINLTLVPFFFVISMQVLAEDASIIVEILWVTYAALELLLLSGHGYAFWSKDEKAVLDDELAQHYRAIAYRWGFHAALLSAFVVFFAAAPLGIDARGSIMSVILAGIVTAALRFAILDHDDGEED